MWHWGIVKNIWRGSGTELHEYVRVLLHLQQFLIRRQVRCPPYGPWAHVPAHVWTAPTQEDKDDEDVVGDDGDVCALCCTKSDREKMSMGDKCEASATTIQKPPRIDGNHSKGSRMNRKHPKTPKN